MTVGQSGTATGAEDETGKQAPSVRPLRHGHILLQPCGAPLDRVLTPLKQSVVTDLEMLQLRRKRVSHVHMTDVDRIVDQRPD